MEPDAAELEELTRTFAGEAGTALANALPGRNFRSLSTAEAARAEAVLATFCDRADQRWSFLPGHSPLGAAGRKLLAERLWDEIFGLGYLERYCDDREPDCEEASLDGCHKLVLRRAGNRVQIVDPGFGSDEEFRAYVQRVIEMGGRRVDDASPYATVALPNGCRATAVVSISSSPRLTLRIPRVAARSLEDLVSVGTIDAAVCKFFHAAVLARLNIIVTGATFSGKTTFVQCLAGSIPDHERVITIEQDPELALERIVAQCVDLWERPPNLEGVGAVTMRELVRLSLRMRPDRIVVGEVRGAEAIEMLAAMNSGHAGSFCTLHADAGRRGLTKLEHYIRHGDGHWTPQAAKESIAENVDLVVHLREDAALGRRVVEEILEVAGCENGEVINTNTLYRRRGGELVPTGFRPRWADRLEEAGWSPP
jgi:pilus assembly protein CpaF